MKVVKIQIPTHIAKVAMIEWGKDSTLNLTGNSLLGFALQGELLQDQLHTGTAQPKTDLDINLSTINYFRVFEALRNKGRNYAAGSFIERLVRLKLHTWIDAYVSKGDTIEYAIRQWCTRYNITDEDVDLGTLRWMYNWSQRSTGKPSKRKLCHTA